MTRRATMMRLSNAFTLGLFCAASACADSRPHDLFTSGVGAHDSADATVGMSEHGTSAASGTGGFDDDDGAAVKLDVGDDGDPGDGATCPCNDVEDGIYLVSSTAELWFYDPLTNDFSRRGAFGCPSEGTINSMGIDRRGRAWLNYVELGIFNPTNPVSGKLFRASIDDPSACADSGVELPADGFAQFGMGFAVQSEGSSCDELYLFDGGTSFGGASAGAVASVDPNTLAFATLGKSDYAPAELTGTGDGRLFAFTNGPSGALLLQLDKDTAASIEEIPLTGLTTTDSFAFAFWGGDFYFFTTASGGVSEVTHLDYDGNDGHGLEVVQPQAPALFIGAGVSTCASYTPVG